MNKIKKHVVMRNKAFHLLYTFFMNKVSEYDTKQLLQELSLGRLNYKEILIREIKKDVRPSNESTSRVYGRRNNLITRKPTIKEELRNIDLITYIFLNIKGFLEYQYIRRLTHDDIKNMARFIRYEFYPKDTYIFRQGEKCDKFYGVIDGNVQIVEAKYTDKFRALKELMIKIDEREKITEEDKIFFLSGKNYKEEEENEESNNNNILNFFYDNNNTKTNSNNKYIDDDISIKTKEYFMSKENDEEIKNEIFSDDNNSTNSLDENFFINNNNYFKNRNYSYNFTRNKICRIRYYKMKSISRIVQKYNTSKLTMRNSYNKKKHSENHLTTKGIVSKLVYKALKKYRKIKKENKLIIINDIEKNNVDFLSKNLMSYGKILTEGSCFGDQEMSKKKKRNYSLLCLTDCHIFSLKKDYFDKYMLSKIIRSEMLKTNFILDKLNVVSKEENFFKLITKIIPSLYHKGHILYTPFDSAHYLYLVYKGECAICETYKPFNDKNEFLSEKPEMKMISILNEGGIGGLEGYQKGINYERYMIVNSSLTIILKLDIRDFDDNTYRFRRSLEPLYYQQQRMIYSTQRKGIYFQIGREINKNNQEKIKLKNDIKKSMKFNDKNKFSSKFLIKNENIKKNNDISKNNFNDKKYNNQVKPFLFNKNNIINNYSVSTEAKLYSPIKLLITQKKLEIEDTTSVLTSFAKGIKNKNINNTQQSSIINSNVKSFDGSLNINSNYSTNNNTIYKQKKYYSFYHQKYGRNPISLKGYFSQEKNENPKINRYLNIKKSIYKIRGSLNNNIFNFYNEISNNLKTNTNKDINRYSWDKLNLLTEESTLQNDSKKNNILNVCSSIRTKKTLQKKISSNNIKHGNNRYSTFNIRKLPILNNL